MLILFFNVKEECKVYCVKIIAWLIVVEEGTNIQFSNMVLNILLNLNVVLNILLKWTFENQNVAGVQSHELLEWKNILFKNALNWTKAWQFVTATPKKYLRCKQSGRRNVQKRTVASVYGDIFIFWERIGLVFLRKS